MKAIESAPAPRRSLLAPGLVVVAAFLVLVGLGTWQLQRRAWKDGLIAALSERLAADPVPLPARADWAGLDPARDEFRRVVFNAAFRHGEEALVYAAPSSLRAGGAAGSGYFVFTPAQTADGGLVLVNRGFVPDAKRDAAARPEGQAPAAGMIVGALRWPEAPSLFSPAADAAKNLWFVRDPAAIAAAKGIGAAPFYIEQEAPAPAGGWPQPARLQPNLPNHHLGYALTWFGLAGALLAVFGAWAVARMRGSTQ